MHRMTWLGCAVLLAAWGCGNDGGDAGADAAAPAADAAVASEADAASDSEATGTAVHSLLAGSFAPLAGYEDAGIWGKAQLVRTLDQQTMVHVQVGGLAPATEYPAHVHALPCAFAGGGHYKIDPTIAEVVPENEIWPAFLTDADGIGTASVTAAHMARGDAMSVVVHDPADGSKMACADLRADDSGEVVATGTIAPFAAAEEIDATITGSASLRRQDTLTIVQLDLSGLSPEAEYRAHVHALPCAVNDAGGHYKLDPLVEEVIEDNELWPTVTVSPAGTSADSFAELGHRARADAQSVVVHRVTPEGAPKVACADLVRDGYPGLLTEGTAQLTAIAGERGYDGLIASATMERALSGVTTVELTATGLQAGLDYPVHVHALPCAVAGGGGHYEIDVAVEDVIEANELWVGLTADGSGASSRTAGFGHLARPEAQSLVIHDPVDKERLACIDLDVLGL